MALSVLRRCNLAPVLCRNVVFCSSHAGSEGPEPSRPMSFHQLPLSGKLKKRLKDLGYTSMFPIQSETIPLSLSGCDVLGRAETGSGKTLCYAVPIVQALSEKKSVGQPRALAILPTRELCTQVYKVVESLDRQLKIANCVGGESIAEQKADVKLADFVVGTPGRLKDFLERGHLKLNNIHFLVLDEVDELLGPSFIDQIENLLRELPSDKQAMMFSATLSYGARSLAKRFMRDPVYINLTSEMKRVPSSVKHIAMPVEEGREVACILHLMHSYKPERTIIFVPSKKSATDLGKYLKNKCEVDCETLQGDMRQSQRTEALDKFVSGVIKVLVSTDVAARGLDIPGLELVIQVGAPLEGVKFYIHRSGRTGRAGRPGINVLLCYQSDAAFLLELGNEVSVSSMPPPKQDHTKPKLHPWEGHVLHLGLGPKALRTNAVNNARHLQRRWDTRKNFHRSRQPPDEGGERTPFSSHK